MKVIDILTKKGNNVETVSPNASVLEVLKLMEAKNIGSIVVADEQEGYKGIVTERDYSRKVILKGKNSTDTLVSEIMSTDLPKLSPTDSIDKCMEHMSQKHIRYLPVFNNGKLAGIISMSDVVTAKLKGQQETISHLEQYISGS
ncbi:MAG TPA: CBS domain-containing protein [Phnomibacter sp.]|nr:CBS domain-containing protein [Phnomibacter sp.]